MLLCDTEEQFIDVYLLVPLGWNQLKLLKQFLFALFSAKIHCEFSVEKLHTQDKMSKKEGGTNLKITVT